MFDEHSDFIEGIGVAVAMYCDQEGIHRDEDREDFVDLLSDTLYEMAVEPYIAFGKE